MEDLKVIVASPNIPCTTFGPTFPTRDSSIKKTPPRWGNYAVAQCEFELSAPKNNAIDLNPHSNILT